MSTMKTTRDVKGVGVSIPRPDGPEKVTGRVQYVADIKPGESSTVRLVYTANKGTTGRMTADVTPQINPVAISTRKFDCAKVLK